MDINNPTCLKLPFHLAKQALLTLTLSPMASFSPLLLFLLVSLSALLISPSQAATACPSTKFKNNKVFANCTVLSALDSHLYYSYNASNSSLAVAFVAAPSKPGGWIAWAINPTGTKMSGAQAIVAYTKEDGIPAIKTLNITSYNILTPGKLAFDFWDTSAELASGTLTIFATVKVPEKAETVNQVWQVGPGINKTTGYLEKHEFGSQNLVAYGPLSLVATGTSSTTTTTNTTSGSATNTTSGQSGAPLRIGDGGHVGLLSILLLVLGALIVF
ncbi:PREDICTED: auxin-induced in root cultures protein 12 [Fragaria vesca subsp. vesca]|uniref:auxin-induced in root cultures protein 12 n=1 Tax=Fragaria vesca subsp. vesca TaxID=101020 RepID=UPI0002C33901|nr:PREDICTED: auxin-induced in root cultures protein 12 [Fragaria vesca subsp. vesca]